MIDLLLSVSASILLLVAVVARGLVLTSQRNSSSEAAPQARSGVAENVSVVARLGAALMLGGALTCGIHDSFGGWADDHRLLAFGLLLSMILVDLGLTRAGGASCASPVLEGLGAMFLLVVVFVSPSGSSTVLCGRGWVFYHARWALYLVGVGSLLAAGSATLMAWVQRLQVARGATWHGSAAEASIAYVHEATLLALLTMGSGLTLGAWWFWQAQGQLTGNDVREIWMAIAWLLSGSSLLAWESTVRVYRWSAGLVVLAGLSAVAGLLTM